MVWDFLTNDEAYNNPIKETANLHRFSMKEDTYLIQTYWLDNTKQ